MAGPVPWRGQPGLPAEHLIERLVADFYERAWNRWDDRIVDEILTPDFAFRGSLGNAVQGRDGWREYRDVIRAAVPDFHNEVVDLVVAGDRAAARLRYTGHHRGVLLGVPGSGAPIDYAGAAFFTAVDGVLSAAWVLGDLDTLRRQLGSTATSWRGRLREAVRGWR